MIRRVLLSVAIGLVGAVLVHISVIELLPSLAENNAWGRFSNLGGLDRVLRVEPLRSQGTGAIAAPSGSTRRDFAFVDPAFVTASCRFSLDGGPVHLLATGVQTTFWTASIYDRDGDNLYSINDRAAVDGAFDLLVGTSDQLAETTASLAADSEGTTIPVVVDMQEGYLTIRVLVDEESKRPEVEEFVSSIRCQPVRTVTGNADATGRNSGRVKSLLTKSG